MIYAVRRQLARHTLVEFKSRREMDARNVHDFPTHYEAVRPSYARQWVRNGREHETGLYLDGDRVRHARAEG